MKRRTFLSLMGAAALTSSMMLTGCGAGSGDDRKIVRIGHVQSQTHPDHLGLEAFANYINEKLGDKYRVEVYPSELLGSQTEMVQLTQTGAIDFVVASTAIMETFSAKYQIFNLPYLFSSVEAYHEAMDDPEVTDPIFKTTSKAGLETVAWLDAGTRNFYTIKTPINQPSDLKGLKIRVQQSPTNVEMMRLLGGTATPMGFGDVYTALQAGILDGAENSIVNGFTDGSFKPERVVTREQLASILCRYARFSGITTYEAKLPANASVSSWAAKDVAWAYAEGILNAVQTAAAAKNANRAEVAMAIYAYLTGTAK